MTHDRVPSGGESGHGLRREPEDGLEGFSQPTRDWFSSAFHAPTNAQLGAWKAISAGDHALVIAPTGSGKTLAAFLWGLDRLLAPGPRAVASGVASKKPADGGTEVAGPDADDPPAASIRPRDAQHRCRILYVSPLKALAADVERNLRSPLVGIGRASASAGIELADVRVGMRTGDTPPSERRRLVAHPPDILITTPESLYLVLTSQARETLRGVEAVIVDEIHVLAGSKRGAHLALSLERLDALLERPAQRIGLSATVTPAERVARFLTGARDLSEGGRAVRIVRPDAAPRISIDVAVPVPDLTALPEETAGRDAGSVTPPPRAPRPERTPASSLEPAPLAGPAFDEEGPSQRSGGGAGPSTVLTASDQDASRTLATSSVWPHVTERIVDLITAHRSTIVFTNSRRSAERLAARINETWSARLTGEPVIAEGPAAEMPGQSGTAAPASAEIARAHHGSMSRERRTEIETALKSGDLPAVVATSSLELGIDMGSVDLVVQVGAPPSVASTLQRIGRAGHQVGAVSSGVVIPTHRGELLPAAAITRRAELGQIEAVAELRNPLDVLAQQIVAMLAVDELPLVDLARIVRRAATFEHLGDGALHAVLDMLAGRYPSEDFAELRPRIVWDRPRGLLRGRPGALRLAVTSGGTIPDRGLYGVYLATSPARADGETGAESVTSRGRGGRRVGELDEEMVFESRVGDTFTLGSSTWRIEDITPDRVLVAPAAGSVGRLPFWRGDGPRRPVELGRAIGELQRRLGSSTPEEARDLLASGGLDPWAVDNLLAYLAEQREQAGRPSDDRTIVIERFRDELGDWRVVIHSPFGGRVHAPWAVVLTARLRERLGMDVAAMPADDGIVLRLPDVGSSGEDLPITTEDLLIDPVDVADAVVSALAGSAHFASRFREAAARSLLLPRRRPDRRQPLWQQRQRAAQLLAVAAQHPDFPVVLEAVRECLQDDFDTEALTDLMAKVLAREISVVEVTTPAPSPFARSLLFGYVGQFIYDGDAPLAERRLAALTLDQKLLAELMGEDAVDLSDILDPEAIAQVSAEAGLRTHPARTAEELWDLIRRLGPVDTEGLALRAQDPAEVPRWLAELTAERRILEVRIAGHPRWADLADASRLRDALGVALPPGIPEELLAPVSDPLGDLVRRFARTHGPFDRHQLAEHLGVGPAAVAETVERLIRAGTLVSARFTPAGPVALDLCDADVLRRIRRRSLAHLRSEIEAVPPERLAAFLPRWQQVVETTAETDPRGSALASTAAGHRRDGVPSLITKPGHPPDLASVVDQLAGARVPASALEPLVLRARVPELTTSDLDRLTASGELMWCGAGPLPGVDGYLALVPSDSPELLPAPGEHPGTPVHQALLDAMGTGGGHFFADLLSSCPEADAATGGEALWDLVWAGLVTNDTLAPVRSRLADGKPAHHTARQPPRTRRALSRRRALSAARSASSAAPHLAGRWSLVRRPAASLEARVLATCAALLERHGVLTRAASGIEDVPGGFAALYPVLTRLEESGAVRRGYFVEGLGAAQFALPECVDLLRRRPTTPVRSGGPDPRAATPPGTVDLLAATDPANPYGAALAWPESSGRPRRAAGAVVLLVDGVLVLFVERGGRTVLSFTDDPDLLLLSTARLTQDISAGRLGRVTVEKIDGGPALAGTGGLPGILREAGFIATPRGLRMRERSRA